MTTIKTKFGTASFSKTHGKGYYIISSSKEGNLLKSSINPSKLINWFTMEYPNEIIKLSNNGGCIDG